MLTSEQLATVVAALESQIERLQDLKELHDYLNGEGYTEQQLSPVTDAIAAVNAMAGVEVATVDNCEHLVTRAQFRRLQAGGWALIRTSEGVTGDA